MGSRVDRCRDAIPQIHTHIHDKMENMISVMKCDHENGHWVVLSQMMSSARRQTLEARLHHPDRVVGRHHMQHISIEEGDHLASAKSVMCEMPNRDFE